MDKDNPYSIDAIVTDQNILRQVSKDTSIEECQRLNIFERLDEALKTAWTPGIGLAAIQIGVPIKAALLKFKGGDFHLFNPKIIEQRDPILWVESCLSIPNKSFKTRRYNEIIIQNGNGKKYTLEKIESIAVQHEIDHFSGLLCTDRTLKPITVEKKPGRNDPCPECLKTGKKIKYKKCGEHYKD